MPEKDLNLDETIGTESLSDIDLSSVSLDDSDSLVDQSEINEGEFATSFSQSGEELDANLQNSELLSDSIEASDSQPTLDAAVVDSIAEGIDNVELDDLDTTQEVSSSIDETLFLESEQTGFVKKKYVDKDTENFGGYLRMFFIASAFILLGILAIAGLYSFNKYILYASQTKLEKPEQQEYVAKYKDKFNKLKTQFGKTNQYEQPKVLISQENDVLRIITADDIDYIDKKDLLSPYVASLATTLDNNVEKLETIRKDVAKQGFLPEELDWILSEDQAIDTIQRSLNALEVIKFSTASKVFSYMDTATQTISEMMRGVGSSPDDIKKLLNQLGEKGEKDISAYVYMCYLNPFEISANCDTIGDLDIYYKIISKNNKDGDSKIDLGLFKNTMNAINQMLEKQDTALFSITFNGFNAQDKNITFTIEVYTNQSDEKSLMAQGKRNPNIFILTSIVNLLKQSSFIIGAEINTKEVNVETKPINLGGLSTFVNYSTKDFTVPIQKDTEREIFDYIDLDGIIRMLKRDEPNVEDVENFSVENENIYIEDELLEDGVIQDAEDVEHDENYFKDLVSNEEDDEKSESVLEYEKNGENESEYMESDIVQE